MKKIVALGVKGEDLGGGVIGKVFIIDDEDEDLMKYRWRYHKGHAVTSDMNRRNEHGKRALVSLHRLIALFKYPELQNEVVKHRDGDKCNCTRGNLVKISPEARMSEGKWKKAQELMDTLNNERLDNNVLSNSQGGI